MKLCWILVLVAAPAEADVKKSPAAAQPRPLYEINREIRELCRKDSYAKSDEERAAAAYEMTVVYREILADPRYATSTTLKGYRGRLWSRLTTIKKDALTKMRREARMQKKADLSDETLLADVSSASQALADHYALIGATAGGAAGIFSQAGAGGGGVGAADFGPELVDLIQQTIQPEFWNVNGGPGSIFYYRAWHCLVIRATSEVHHQIGGVLGAVRE
jgi:hypothetical protein